MSCCYPFAHLLAGRQVIPGVAQDKIVNQIRAHENGAHDTGRTLQKVHDSHTAQVVAGAIVVRRVYRKG